MSTHNAYAIVAAGGKQHRVKEGGRYKFEKIVGEPGETIELNQVLLLAQGDKVELGAPYLNNHKVIAKILQHGRADKIKIFKMRRRKTYRRTQGHRQYFTEVEITKI